ncbi:hypothetical protein ASE65_09895 [Sphingomonas sp. Leaf16]|nr:hypothetical protein ASE65_09895 [Sphingomonas sp. Leaf16]
MLWTMVAMFTIVWGIPFVLMTVGLRADWTAVVLIPLGIAWVLIGGIRSLLIRCPRCGKSVFMRGLISVPWPAKRCSRCRTDLTTCSR